MGEQTVCRTRWCEDLPALPCHRTQTDPACSYARKKDAMNKKNAKKATAEAVETTKAATPSTCASTAAALGLCVLVTLPPAWKVEDPDAKPYWQIEIRDQNNVRYSDVYRVKDLEKAHALAEKIAADRKLPITLKEPPAPRKALPAQVAEAVPMPDPETDAEEGEASPF